MIGCAEFLEERLNSKYCHQTIAERGRHMATLFFGCIGRSWSWRGFRRNVSRSSRSLGKTRLLNRSTLLCICVRLILVSTRKGSEDLNQLRDFSENFKWKVGKYWNLDSRIVNGYRQYLQGNMPILSVTTFVHNSRTGNIGNLRTTKSLEPFTTSQEFGRVALEAMRKLKARPERQGGGEILEESREKETVSISPQRALSKSCSRLSLPWEVAARQ